MTMEHLRNTGIILQARTGSHRLPKKMILPFYKDKSILQILLERIVNKTPSDIKVVLATSVNPSDDNLERIANSLKIEVYRGPEENVLLRFIETAEKYQFRRIIRICGDNPFFDISGTLKLLASDPVGDFDYVSYKVREDKPSILSHLGFWGEVVGIDALKKALDSTDEKKYLEHVTNFIYLHPRDFRIKLVEAPDFVGNREDIRLTVDTNADFELSREIYSHLVKQNIPLVPEQIVNFIDQHPEMKAKMLNQIAINKK